MNLINILQNFLSKGANPKEMVLKTMDFAGGNNPMLNNLIQLANGGSQQQIEQFARNIFKEKGLDCDKEFNNFMSNFNIK